MKENSLPLLTLLSNQILPLCDSIICLDKYKPKPVPADLFLLVPCENLWNIFGISSLGIPHPVSETEKIKVMPKPKKPEILVKKKRRNLSVETSIAAALTALVVLIGGLTVSFLLNGINKEADREDSVLSESTKPSYQWQAPKLSINYSRRFEIKEIMEDNGQTIYIISDSLGDDAVVTLKPAEKSYFDSENWKNGYLDGTAVRYKEDVAYKLIHLMRETR
jgi:hypothetical protein